MSPAPPLSTYCRWKYILQRKDQRPSSQRGFQPPSLAPAWDGRSRPEVQQEEEDRALLQPPPPQRHQWHGGSWRKKSGNLQWKFVQVRNPEGLVIFTATHTNQPKISIRATKPIKKSSMVSLNSTEYRCFLSDPGFPRESTGCAQLFVEFLGRIPLWIGRNI